MRARIGVGHGGNHCGLYHPLQVLAGGDGVDCGDEGTARARHIYPELLKQGERHDTKPRNGRAGQAEPEPRPDTVDFEGFPGQVPHSRTLSRSHLTICQICSLPGVLNTSFSGTQEEAAITQVTSRTLSRLSCSLLPCSPPAYISAGCFNGASWASESSTNYSPGYQHRTRLLEICTPVDQERLPCIYCVCLVLSKEVRDVP